MTERAGTKRNDIKALLYLGVPVEVAGELTMVTPEYAYRVHREVHEELEEHLLAKAEEVVDLLWQGLEVSEIAEQVEMSEEFVVEWKVVWLLDTGFIKDVKVPKELLQREEE